MQGPRKPRKKLKAAQTVIIGISELIEQAKTDSSCASLTIILTDTSFRGPKRPQKR